MPVHKRKKKAVKAKPRAKAKRAIRRKTSTRPKRRKVSAKPKRRTTVSRKRKARKRQHVVKQVERTSVERVLTGRRRHKKRSHSTRPRKRRVVMAGRRSRTRSVGKKGGMGMILALGIGALAVYVLTKKSTPNYPAYSQLPPLTQTGNYQRNDQASSILQYAMAASLGIDAISKLISSLNSSSDNDVQNIYDHVNTTGTLPDNVYV